MRADVRVCVFYAYIGSLRWDSAPWCPTLLLSSIFGLHMLSHLCNSFSTLLVNNCTQCEHLPPEIRGLTPVLLRKYTVILENLTSKIYFYVTYVPGHVVFQTLKKQSFPWYQNIQTNLSQRLKNMYN